MSRLSHLLAGMATIVALSSAVAAAPAPQSPPSDQSDFSHTYLVFFEAGKASLAPEARDILRSAARTAQGMHQARVQVMVPTDGAALAKGRAGSVRAELVRDGLTPRAIVDGDAPQDASFANADPVIRAWLDRRAVIVVSPVPDAGAGDQAMLTPNAVAR